jgi:nicotinamide-nucleotide amidase
MMADAGEPETASGGGETETLSALLPPDIESRAVALLRRAAAAGCTLATAESCTGGLIAALLTDVEGCSHVFERGFIVYSNGSKRQLLGVDPALIEREGVVSRPVAEAMARGAVERSGADICIAVTGYAGDRGADGEAGLVHFCCATRGGRLFSRERHFGPIGRGPTRIACLRQALALIEQALPPAAGAQS